MELDCSFVKSQKTLPNDTYNPWQIILEYSCIKLAITPPPLPINVDQNDIWHLHDNKNFFKRTMMFKHSTLNKALGGGEEAHTIPYFKLFVKIAWQ